MKAIYPGSFNPIHSGHLDIIQKAAKIFDQLIVVVTLNINKPIDDNYLNRLKQVQDLVKDLNNVSVIVNQNQLTVDVAKQVNANYIVKGLRDENDLKHELEYYDGNKLLNPSIETIFLVSDNAHREISSTVLKEIEYYKQVN